MILFPAGIKIARTEYQCPLHVESNPAQWLVKTIFDKAMRRRDALLLDWTPKLLADPNIAEIPADVNALLELIMSHPDYRPRLQADAELDPPEPIRRYNIARFEGRTARVSGNIQRGLARTPNTATLELASTGIEIPDLLANCILAYVQDLEDWILGALLGHINRGKKKMIAQYQPVLMADPDVLTFPATEEELIQVITSRTDYETLPAQLAR